MSEDPELPEPTTEDRRREMGFLTMGHSALTRGWTPYRPTESKLPPEFEKAAATGWVGTIVLVLGIAAVVVLAWWLAGGI